MTAATPALRVRAIRLKPRSAAALITVSLVGLAAFAWPLLIHHDGGSPDLAHSSDAPWLLGVMLPLLLGVLIAEISEGGIDAKALAMLGILAACGAALRPFAVGATGFSLVFFLLIPAGRVLGRGFGFVLGALTLFASALLTAGVGPWLPFQMLGAAWVGFFAGCLPRGLHGRAEVAALAIYGAIAGFAYGLLLNLWFWPFAATGTTTGYVPGAPLADNLHRFVVYDLTTSLGFDVPRAVCNFILVLIAGPAVLRALRRAARRAAFDAPVEFAP